MNVQQIVNKWCDKMLVDRCDVAEVPAVAYRGDGGSVSAEHRSTSIFSHHLSTSCCTFIVVFSCQSIPSPCRPVGTAPALLMPLPGAKPAKPHARGGAMFSARVPGRPIPDYPPIVQPDCRLSVTQDQRAVDVD